MVMLSTQALAITAQESRETDGFGRTRIVTASIPVLLSPVPKMEVQRLHSTPVCPNTWALGVRKGTEGQSSMGKGWVAMEGVFPSLSHPLLL